MRKQIHIVFTEVLLLLKIYKFYNAPCSLFVALKPNACIMYQRSIVDFRVCFTSHTKLTKMAISNYEVNDLFFPPFPIIYTKAVRGSLQA